MENQSKEIFLPRKVFLEKTKILDINLRDYLNSCGLPQSLELFSPNQLKLISIFIQKCVSSEIILTFDDTDFINNQKIENKESLESKIKKTTSKPKQPTIIKQESSKQVNEKQKTTILLKEHQIEAKNCILQEIEQNSRCQFISACGTGKTIVSQRTVEEYIGKFNTSITLILVPSLELLSQFHKSWENNSNFKELFCINFFGDF